MDYARHEFVTDSPWLGIPCVCVLGLAAAVGTFENIIIIIVILLKKTKSAESFLMANLALSDLYITVVADPMSIIGMYMFTLLIVFAFGCCRFPVSL